MYRARQGRAHRPAGGAGKVFREKPWLSLSKKSSTIVRMSIQISATLIMRQKASALGVAI
jgi:hypothetical protein